MQKEPFLYFIAFLMDGCFAFVGLCIPLLALQLGATYDGLGTISATGALAYSLGCLVSGRLSDRVGYRRVMAAACLAVALIFASYLFVNRVLHLIVLSGFTGMVISSFWPPLQAWLGQGKDRRTLLRALGGFNVAWSLGFLVGPALGGKVFEAAPNHVFILGAGLVGMLFLALLLLPIHNTPSSDARAAEIPAFEARSRSFLPIAWAANFATFFAIGTVRSLFPKLATDHGIAPDPLGQLMALVGLAQLTTFFLMSRTSRWQFKLLPLIGAQGLAVLGLSALVFGATPGMFALGLLVHGILAGVTFTASIFYSLFSEGPGGRRTGFHESIVGSGFLLGPLAGGIAAEHLGPRAPYFLSSAVILCAIVFQVYMHKRKPVREWAPQAGD